MANCKKTTIGGQALIEGIMMRGPHKTAMSVRTSENEIKTEIWDTYPNGKPPQYKKLPFIRGVFNMIDTMALGFKCLMKSADLAGVEDEEPSKFDKWVSDKLGKSANAAVSSFAVVLGIALAVLLFIVLPTFVTSLLRPWITNMVIVTLIEGIMKICIFIFYLYFCSKSKDVARVFEYHGAEHKTIACYEAGEALTPENCKKYTRFHPRCGTSFLLIVLVISIILSSFVPSLNPLLRVISKLLLLPLVVGISYEFIKLAGRCDNIFTRTISAPGLWLQRLTTKEPDLEQLQVAITAMNAVIPEDKQDDNW